MKRITCAAIMAGLMLSAFAGGAIAQTRAVGIGVADLEASTQFYQQVLGLEVRRTYELGYLNEVVLGFPGKPGAVVVLMNWPNEQRRYDGDNVKLVFDVDDAAAVMARLREAGGVIDHEAGPIEAVPGVVIGLGRDLDNYVIEVISRP